MKISRTLGTLAASLALTFSALAVPTASADSAVDLVTFGDSMTANPSLDPLHPIAGVDPTAQDREPVVGYGRGCTQDPTNWPRVAAATKGWSVADYSCNGTNNGTTLVSDVESAVSQGVIGEGTRAVVIMYGVLDPSQWVEAAAGTSLAIPSITTYTSAITTAADRIRAAAPNARIILSSYQEVTSGDSVCLINAVPNVPGALVVPGVDGVQVTLHDSMQRAAQAANIEFFDMLAATRGHGMCATPDDQRYVAAVLDFTASHNMKFHPTINGARAMGEIIAAQL